MSDSVKEEVIEGENEPEGFLESVPPEVPQGFSATEWEQLTGGFATEEDEVRSVIAARGSGSSGVGRRTGTRIPSKRSYSNNATALYQRIRAELQDEGLKAVTAASNSDRQAKLQLKKKLQSQERYATATGEQQKLILGGEWEVVAEKRFEACQSAEWMESALQRVYKRWDDIRYQQDLRNHEHTMHKRQKLDDSKRTDQEEPSTYRWKNTFGPGGAFESIQRRIYQDGLEKIKKNRWKNAAEKEQWQAWRDGVGLGALSKDELSIVSSNNWQPLNYELPAGVGDEEDLDEYYKEGRDSAECEEEVLGGSDLEEEFEQEKNEYEAEGSSEEDEGPSEEELSSSDLESTGDKTLDGESE